MINSPIITVSIATFNAKCFLAKAVDSILHQSFTNFELLIIDDGSEDGTAELIATYNDSRIIYIRHDQNQGLMKCRQKAIELARGVLIVWQDADDWSAPNRLERIFMAFEENPNLTACGSFAIMENTNDEIKSVSKRVVSGSQLRTELLFGFPFISPSMGFKSAVLKKILPKIPVGIKQAEDYVFLSLLWQDNCLMENVAEPLYHYRIHNNIGRITSAENNKDIVAGRFIAQKIMLSAFGITPSDNVLILHDKLTYYPDEIQSSELAYVEKYCNFLKQLIQNNNKFQLVDSDVLHTCVSRFVYKLLTHQKLSYFSAIVAWLKYGFLCSPLLSIKIPIKKIIA